ncbi:MAG: hypothetical protein C0506_13235 [Anaerolinea sp.]|nr:hypothetical protein [Anaerolinea sp.]
MDYGTLRVTTPDGQVREYPIDVPSVIVGRADGNRVVIDHVSVSRRHATLTIENGRVMLEDLGSASGTFVGSQRLPVNTPSLVDAGQTLRFGDVEGVFIVGTLAETQPAGDAGRTSGTSSGQAPSAGEPAQTIAVSLASPGAAIAAGSPTTATVTVQNRGNVVDELSITVPDLPAAWVKVSRPSLSLVPNARDEVTIVIQPPRTSESAAGEYPFSVAVVSRETGREVRALGKVTVLPFEGFKITLAPVRARRDFKVTAENTGNVPLSFALSGVQDDNALDFQFEEESLALDPGARKDVRIQVLPRNRKMLGAQQITPFRIEAKTGSGPKATADGQLRVSPPLQKWKWPVVAIIVLGVAAGVAWGVMQRGGGKDEPAPASASPTPAPAGAGTPTAAPSVIHKGGNAVVINSDPNPPANDNCLAVRSGSTPVIQSTNIVGRLCTGTKVAVKDGPTNDGVYFWWQIEGKAADGKTLTGWSAEKRVDGSGQTFLQFTP